MGKFKKYKKFNQNQQNPFFFFFFFLQNQQIPYFSSSFCQDEDLIEESTADENRSPNTENEVNFINQSESSLQNILTNQNQAYKIHLPNQNYHVFSHFKIL